MDSSSELVHSLLPVFLVTTLGASALIARRDRRHRRSRRTDREDLLRGAQRLFPPPQAACCHRLRPCRGDQAVLRHGDLRRLGLRGAHRRPYRQGHPRRARDALVADITPAGAARRRLRPPAVARHRRRRRRAAARHRTDGPPCRQHPRGPVVRGDPRHRLSPDADLRREGTHAAQRPRQSAHRSAGATFAPSHRHSGVSSPSAPCSRSPASAKPSSSFAPRIPASASASCRWSWSS